MKRYILGYLGSSIPHEIVELLYEYYICREFHVLPSQLDNEDVNKMDLFMEIMALETQRQKKNF